jgi:tetratricopeptide (TPR) repeat protein
MSKDIAAQNKPITDIPDVVAVKRGLIRFARFDKEKNEKALADYTEAIRLNPHDASAFFGRGSAYYNREDKKSAMADYTEAIRLEPNQYWFFYCRACLYLSGGFKKAGDRAIADYTEAARLDPNDAAAFYERGRVYHGKHNYKNAMTDYTEAIRLDPNHYWAFYHRADLYLAGEFEKDQDKASADFAEAIRRSPPSWRVIFLKERGSKYYDEGDYDKAIADFTENITNPRLYSRKYTSMSFYYRGLSYSGKGDIEKAIADFTEAVKLCPNDDTYKKRLEEARQKLGNQGE